MVLPVIKIISRIANTLIQIQWLVITVRLHFGTARSSTRKEVRFPVIYMSIFSLQFSNSLRMWHRPKIFCGHRGIGWMWKCFEVVSEIIIACASPVKAFSLSTYGRLKYWCFWRFRYMHNGIYSTRRRTHEVKLWSKKPNAFVMVPSGISLPQSLLLWLCFCQISLNLISLTFL